ncbi:hypothetical protein K3N28_18555 [Glycomyces sp. TRM65418]|uniref:hypothetical protein n=1 Tax=Glycomyces sp. TRM65418 TaxID=2867006 RepID=UPI001CE69672|nr:hypothetical protein [Glycomyces sp. TRM65418]MCC3765064.1 hypothetical protein [Glycomyces sp. TRM65418]QZD54693.1 hypothetical protein K3N28_18465 [Glycomyces sp. TRM65418]
MTDGRAEALQRLDVLVGEWTLEVRSTDDRPEPGPAARSRFEWALDRQFLLQRTEVPDSDVPDSLAIIGTESADGSYTQHYFDSRGVARLYAMTFDGRVWTLRRESPDFAPLDFHQRFTGAIGDDGDTVSGTWETRRDGADWQHDFALDYRRIA